MYFGIERYETVKRFSSLKKGSPDSLPVAYGNTNENMVLFLISKISVVVNRNYASSRLPFIKCMIFPYTAIEGFSYILNLNSGYVLYSPLGPTG